MEYSQKCIFCDLRSVFIFCHKTKKKKRAVILTIIINSLLNYHHYYYPYYLGLYTYINSFVFQLCTYSTSKFIRNIKIKIIS